MLADVYFVLILIFFITCNSCTQFFFNFMILIYPKKCEKSNESKKKGSEATYTFADDPVAAKQISRYFKYI